MPFPRRHVVVLFVLLSWLFYTVVIILFSFFQLLRTSMISTAPLSQSDPDVYHLIQAETRRQEYGLEMIPSENFASEAVLEACGSVFTNKYAEGRPRKRYYGGCEVCDEVEELAQDRATELFGAEFVNVQPHSGATANQAVFEALLSPGETVMGMKLDHGGHLTHGHKVNFSGKHYNVVAYGVRQDDHLIDADEVMTLAKENKPKLIIAGASAYSRKIDFEMFRRVADEVGATLLADIAHYAGLVAADEYPSPVPHAHLVTTTTHKTLRGPRSGFVMGKKEFAKDVHRAVFPGIIGCPHMHTIAAKAVAFKEAMQPSFKKYIQGVKENAKALSDSLKECGLEIVSGGTDSHLVLVDVRPANITGKEASLALEKVGITANMNTIPFDPKPPAVCSGVRFGTPGLTTRGMGVAELKKIAVLIDKTLKVHDNVTELNELRKEAVAISSQFPLYRHRLVSDNEGVGDAFNEMPAV